MIEANLQAVSESLKDASKLDSVLSSLDGLIRESVSNSKTELEKQFAKLTQLNELIEKVTCAGNTMKTNYEIKLRKRHEGLVNAEHLARLELERSNNEVQRMLLVCTEDYVGLSKQIQHLASLSPSVGSSAVVTLEKAQKWLEDIKPTPCASPGCPHVGLYRYYERHKAACLFAMHLMPRSAVETHACDSCNAGFALAAMNSKYEEYAGTFDPGPCQFIDDDKDEWFHQVDRSRQRIVRIKYSQHQRWVLTYWEGPGQETEVMVGSDSQNVDAVNFEGLTMTPKPTLSWAATYTAAKLSKDSVKLIYVGGMWCPYCPPFTKKLKLFFDIITESIDENAVQIIFA